MPEEMVNFVEQETHLKALIRVGGDIETLKRLAAAGYPVVVEKGIQPHKDWWMGHYVLITGYNDEHAIFITQDSYVMADYSVSYMDFSERWWRDFNYLYLVIYPPEDKERILALLGPHADPGFNIRAALAKAEQEIQLLAGRDLFFAWYNKGSNLAALGNYAEAAEAYDQAFALYAQLDEAERPWRMIWYQTGPYLAYYHSSRYQDVIQLANTSLKVFSKGGLEESYYWRGLAREALGETTEALYDLQRARKLNVNYVPALEALQNRGVMDP
jgi:tetratricopeptide (TPR) repeat protein